MYSGTFAALLLTMNNTTTEEELGAIQLDGAAGTLVASTEGEFLAEAEPTSKERERVRKALEGCRCTTTLLLALAEGMGAIDPDGADLVQAFAVRFAAHEEQSA